MQNNNYLTKEKTQALIDGLGIKQSEGKAFLDGLAAKGYTIQGYNDQPKPEEGLLNKIGKGIISSERKFGEDIAGALSNVLPESITGVGALKEANQARQDTIDTALKGLKQAKDTGKDTKKYLDILSQASGTPITTVEDIYPALKKTGMQVAGDAAGVLLDIVTAGSLPGTGTALATGATKGFAPLVKEVAKGTAIGAGTGYGYDVTQNLQEGQTGLEAVQPGTATLVGGALGGAIPLAVAGTQKAIKFAKDPIGYGSSIKQDIQSYAGSKSVQPQFGSSVERLTTSPIRVETPLATYNRYLPQAEKSLTDIKVDAPISDVGSKIGDAFRKVVDLRRTAGSIMGQELKTVGKTKVNIEPIFMDFETALKDSGLTYNGMTKKIMASDLSKVAPDDIAIIEDFVQELNKAGTNPSVARIDAILSRVSDKINYAKSAKGISQTTNGERIVKGALAKLRNSFENVPGLEKYNQARANYAELSDFIDEGSGFLGKTTQSGDFAKDASLAKSAVQSILNNGKKDWLLKLEGLTDYPALDEATLALQAMKDAGDYRGLSLLQTLSEGQIPTSKAGFTQKLIDYGIEKGTNIVAGSPAQRTRAYLKSLENALSKEAPNTITKNSAIPAKGLIKTPTNKGIKTSNVDIKGTIPQSTKAATKVGENFAIVPPMPTQDENGNWEITPESLAFSMLGSIGLKKLQTTKKGDIAKLIDKDMIVPLKKYMDNPTEANMVAARVVGQKIGLADKFILDKENFMSFVNQVVQEKDRVMKKVAPMLEAKAAKSAIPKELQPLAEEASKYKSAEEFVKAQGTPVYRGGADVAIDKSKMTDEGLAVSMSDTIAGTFARGGQKGSHEIYLAPNSKVAKFEDIPKNLIGKYDSKLKTYDVTDNGDGNLIAKWAKENGFDAVDMSKFGLKEMRIVNADKAKTKQQLIDIWNKANNK